MVANVSLAIKLVWKLLSLTQILLKMMSLFFTPSNIYFTRKRLNESFKPVRWKQRNHICLIAFFNFRLHSRHTQKDVKDSHENSIEFCDCKQQTKKKRGKIKFLISFTRFHFLLCVCKWFFFFLFFYLEDFTNWWKYVESKRNIQYFTYQRE